MHFLFEPAKYWGGEIIVFFYYLSPGSGWLHAISIEPSMAGGDTKFLDLRDDVVTLETDWGRKIDDWRGRKDCRAWQPQWSN